MTAVPADPPPNPETRWLRVAGRHRAARRPIACRRITTGGEARLARTEPDILDEVRLRNDQASRLLAVDLQGLVPHARETARLLVAATADAALFEFDAGRPLPRMRQALPALVPDARVG